ncbi:pyruvate carboxylase [soil metagenome]
MTSTVLIANRGEISTRIARAAGELGIRSVAIFAADEAQALHRRSADTAVELGQAGVAAYLDIDRIVAVALEAGCTMVHPGYGFLSEQADFARRCEAAGLVFIGPTPHTLETYGDKAAARALALRCDVPLLAGTPVLADASQARAFFELTAGIPILLKAVAGGGGRGIRLVSNIDDIAEAFERCASEARTAFGNDALYAEQFLPDARHVEVQIIGDGSGEVMALGERECTLQRRHQKLVEFAPSPSIGPAMREGLFGAALRMAASSKYRGLGTFEFLVSGDRFVFLEANPRLQVEHTVTEAVTGLDLVQLQFLLAQGKTLRELLPASTPEPRGRAMQLRINMETLRSDGNVLPSGGELQAFDAPSGPGVRVDSCAFTGFVSNPGYDSLLAKLIVHTAGDSHALLLHKAFRSLCEFRIEGIATNLPFLQALLQNDDVIADRVDTRWIERNAALLFESSQIDRPALHAVSLPSASTTPRVVATLDEPGAVTIGSPVSGRVVAVSVQVGEDVTVGQTLAIVEAMKSEFVIVAERRGTIARIVAGPGTTVLVDAPLFMLVADDEGPALSALRGHIDLDLIRADLQQVFDAHHKLTDEARPDAVDRRRKTSQRTARENVADLCDTGSFVEYGGLALAAQRSRRTVEELEKLSPADGVITGIGDVNGDRFDATRTRCAVVAYDYTVFAGTQGHISHEKKRRLLRLAHKWKLPLVLFAEGGGGRPGDTDNLGGDNLRLYNPTFWGFARLSLKVPVICIVSGRCFAGNAALLAVCNVVIATADATIGMGGPAMIEGGGLGAIAAEDVGPVSTQRRNGVVDIVVRDEAEAVATAKRYLAYFQGRLEQWTAGDMRRLRHVVPEDPRAHYEMREVIRLLADDDSVLELRRDFGIGMITALIRIEGHAIAVLANNPAHLSGAIDAEGSDKAARFIALADASGLPVLSLCDTPGFMVGAEAEATGLVRRAGQMFIEASRISVPYFTVAVRQCYGLGAVAMVGGNAHEQLFAVSWPTGHFGKMGLEGYVKLAFRKELGEIADPAERKAKIESMVAALHVRGTALSTAPYLSIDDVIDPIETRRWLMLGLATARQQRGEARLEPEPQSMW